MKVTVLSLVVASLLITVLLYSTIATNQVVTNLTSLANLTLQHTSSPAGVVSQGVFVGATSSQAILQSPAPASGIVQPGLYGVSLTRLQTSQVTSQSGVLVSGLYGIRALLGDVPGGFMIQLGEPWQIQQDTGGAGVAAGEAKLGGEAAGLYYMLLAEIILLTVALLAIKR